MRQNSPRLSLALQHISQSDQVPNHAKFRRWVRVAIRQTVKITLRIVDEEEAQKLNKTYRGKDYPTNVLTFVYDQIDSQTIPSDVAVSTMSLPVLSGDVVFCAPVVMREAEEQRKNLDAHYAHLTIHALLHLQGYDHEAEAEAIEMEALETALMLKLHYPDPYLGN